MKKYLLLIILILFFSKNSFAQNYEGVIDDMSTKLVLVAPFEKIPSFKMLKNVATITIGSSSSGKLDAYKFSDTYIIFYSQKTDKNIMRHFLLKLTDKSENFAKPKGSVFIGNIHENTQAGREASNRRPVAFFKK